jgi:hypothetical protein
VNPYGCYPEYRIPPEADFAGSTIKQFTTTKGGLIGLFVLERYTNSSCPRRTELELSRISRNHSLAKPKTGGPLAQLNYYTQWANIRAMDSMLENSLHAPVPSRETGLPDRYTEIASCNKALPPAVLELPDIRPVTVAHAGAPVVAAEISTRNVPSFLTSIAVMFTVDVVPASVGSE